MQRVRLSPPNITAADPTFTRLIAELQLTHAVERQIARGATALENLRTVQSLERDTFRHLLGYLGATGFVAEIDGVEVGE